MSYKIITISRQCGSGGHTIGQALAEKLELLIKDSELRIKMGAAGRVKYQNEFTLQAFETKLQEILETILLKETRKHL